MADLSGRGKIRVTGEDCVRLLHSMMTNHVEQLSPGQGCYGFLLSPQGRILADVNLIRLPEAVLLDTEPETAGKVCAHLDKHIIADDVTLENLTGRIATVGLEGPRSAAILSSLGAPTPAASHETADWGDRHVSRLSVTGAEGYRIFLPAAGKAAFIEQLTSAGAAVAGAGDIRTVRLENGRPRYGEDINESNLPQETQLMHALHFNKGCYLGQETVERIRSRGHVNRLLVQLHIASAAAPSSGAKLTADGKQAGEITSAAISPALGCVVALAYIRTQHAREGTRLEVAQWEPSATATVSAQRPS